MSLVDARWRSELQYERRYSEWMVEDVFLISIVSEWMNIQNKDVGSHVNLSECCIEDVLPNVHGKGSEGKRRTK